MTYIMHNRLVSTADRPHSGPGPLQHRVGTLRCSVPGSTNSQVCDRQQWDYSTPYLCYNEGQVLNAHENHKYSVCICATKPPLDTCSPIRNTHKETQKPCSTQAPAAPAGDKQGLARQAAVWAALPCWHCWGESTVPREGDNPNHTCPALEEPTISSAHNFLRETAPGPYPKLSAHWGPQDRTSGSES